LGGPGVVQPPLWLLEKKLKKGKEKKMGFSFQG